MYREFSILSIDTNLDSKIIVVNTNFDIDENSINSANVILFSRNDSSEVLLTYEVKGKAFIIHIEEDLIPNTEYILKISNIKNILGQKLVSGLIRHIVYEIKVTEIPEMIRPVNYEEVSDTIEIELTTNNQILEDYSYNIEISDDVAFINIVREINIGKSGKASLSILPIGQYYIRARLQYLEEGKKAFGQWSSKITFLCITKQDDDNKKEDGGGNDDTGDISPVYKKEIKLINYPKNGETPESFILEFSDNIDPNFKGEIYIIRRDT